MSGHSVTRVNPSMGRKEWMLLILLSVLWGGSFFFVGVAVSGLPPFTIVALRVAIAAGTLLLVLRITGLHIPRNRELWRAFAVMGVINNAIPFSLIVWGQTRIASGLAAILIAATPFFVVLVAHFLTDDEKVTRARLLGLLIGFAGVVIIIGPAVLNELGANLWAQVAVLGAAISYAFAGVYGRRFQRMGVSPLVTANGQLIVSSALLVPLALIVDRPWTLPAPGAQVALAVIGLGLLSTALAYIVFFRLLAASGATSTALVAFLIPVSAVLLGFLFLGEPLVVRQLAGMALLAIGMAVMDGRLLARRARAPATEPAAAGLPADEQMSGDLD